MFAECDTLLIVGSTFPYIEYYPKPGQVRSVQIDIDPARIGLRFPVEAGIVGDAAETLRALNALLQRKADRRFLEQAQALESRLVPGAERRRRSARPADEAGAGRARSERSARSPTRSSPPTAATTPGSPRSTSGSSDEQRFAVSGTLASMGGGLPYAIAAALAYPGRQVVAIVGDGGLSMSIAELATCVRYQLPVKIVVLNNSSLAQIKWEQMLFLGNPEFGCDLQPVDFATVAEGFGVRGFRLEDPEQCGATLDAALAHAGPALIDAVVDANEPMLPPKRREHLRQEPAQGARQGTPGRARSNGR